MFLDPCASNAEIAKFCKETKMSETDVKHYQVAYLYHVLQYPRALISNITGYAVTTLSAWKKKALEWVDKAKGIFEKGIIVANEFVSKICGNCKEIIWETEKVYSPCAYIVEYFDKAGEFMNLKIGMTGRPLEQRMKEHLYNQKTNNGLAKIVVKHVFRCEDEDDAGAMECVLRKHYRHKNNNADYVPNDRFNTQRFSLEDILNDDSIKVESARLCY